MLRKSELFGPFPSCSFSSPAVRTSRDVGFAKSRSAVTEKDYRSPTNSNGHPFEMDGIIEGATIAASGRFGICVRQLARANAARGEIITQPPVRACIVSSCNTNRLP